MPGFSVRGVGNEQERGSCQTPAPNINMSNVCVCVCFFFCFFFPIFFLGVGRRNI